MTTPQKPRRRPQGTKPTDQPYHWFQGASVRALYDQIGAIGADIARVEVRQRGDKMTFRVVGAVKVAGADDDASADINDSRRCPPICQ
jgi:hypothetical protein